MDSKTLLKIVVILLFGVLVGSLLARIFPPYDYNVEIFQREGKPAVMRIYTHGIDILLVEDNKRYISLEQYLKRFANKFDRQIEKLAIKKAAEWDKE